jgi:cytoskeletal protein RodZ
MATKTEIASRRAFLRGKKQGKVKEEKHALGILTAAVIVLLYLLLAQHFGWWPYSRPNLGSAFYTNVSASTSPTSGKSGNSSSSSTHSTGSTGSNGASGSNGSNGSSSSGSSSTTPIATFAAGVNVGDTQAQVSADASGLGQNCSVVASASTANNSLGQQQVCVYTQGNKVVTVTFLNGRTISASKSGF